VFAAQPPSFYLAPPRAAVAAARATLRSSQLSPDSAAGDTVRRVRSAICAVLVPGVLAVLATAPPATAAPSPQVTVIGDSVLTAVLWNDQARSILERGFDMHLDIGVCRRLTGVSCTYEGGRVPTLVDLVHDVGTGIGRTVVVEVGYNDDPATFDSNLEEATAALLSAGAKRIVWVNMREWQPQYVGMNERLRVAALRHPELTIVDWEAYSHEHYLWFQGDGIHLVHDGAVAIATLLREALLAALAPPLIAATTVLPVGRVGDAYTVTLAVQGGTPPYRWRLSSGSLPRGLHLLADGRVSGIPRRACRLRLTLRTTDAFGRAMRITTSLVVKAARTRAQHFLPAGTKGP
jgi:hypothetical protein